MRVQDLMTRPVATCHVNDTMKVATRLMWDHDCGVLPVVNDEGKLTGLITDRDICMAAFTQGRSLDAMLVHSAMASHVIVARPNQTIGEIEEIMSKHRIRRVPVVDDDGTPIGMISLNDLARESVQPDTKMKNAAQKLVHTLAAISQPHSGHRRAA